MVFPTRPVLPRARADRCVQILTSTKGRLMRHNRLLACAAAALAILTAVPVALAAGAHHSRQLHGRVIAINARHHTLRLRVLHAKRASAASAADGHSVVVSFGDAKVTGPNGAISVGDDVRRRPSRATAAARPSRPRSRSSARPTAATPARAPRFPAQVTGVDASAGTLTLAVLGTDGQGNTQMTSLIVNVSSTTILAVADTNGDGQVTIADIKVGDHVIVFTTDATANPVAAVGILDASHSGGDHQGGDDGDGPQAHADSRHGHDRRRFRSDDQGHRRPDVRTGARRQGHAADLLRRTGWQRRRQLRPRPTSPRATRSSSTHPIRRPARSSRSASSTAPRTARPPQYSAFNGTVAAPVGANSAQVRVGGDGPLAGQTVTVQVTSTTHYKGQNANGGQVTALADVESGDIVSVYVLGTLSNTPIVAAYFADRGTGASSDPPASPAPPAPSTAPLARFGGTVTSVRGDGLTVTVTSGGPLTGQSVIVAIGPNVSFQTSNGTGSGTGEPPIHLGRRSAWRSSRRARAAPRRSSPPGSSTTASPPAERPVKPRPERAGRAGWTRDGRRPRGRRP